MELVLQRRFGSVNDLVVDGKAWKFGDQAVEMISRLLPARAIVEVQQCHVHRFIVNAVG